MAATILRWGMLSTARIGLELIPGFARSTRSNLVAVASRDPARAMAYAQAHGIEKAHGRYESLLDDPEIDCLYVSLPNSLHAEWVRRALESGKHVLCEKPLTPTPDEAQGLFDLAERSGLVLAEAFMYRHHPKTLRAREIIASGDIGEPRVVSASFSFTVEDPTTDIRYRADLAGGALFDVGCYCVNFATYALDQSPDEARGIARPTSSGVDESFFGTLGFPSGAVAQFDCSLAMPLSVGATVAGSHGAISIAMPWYAHLPPASIRVVRGDREEEIPTPGDNAYFLEIENFAGAVLGEERPRISRAETVRNLEAIQLLRRATQLT
jgi:xylose dehydrogenase (NAD/NADP)